MKNFKRTNLLFSLCGLNCGLCPMNLNKSCPGCGGGEGNQSCSLARCSLQHGKVEYCFQCENYPCPKYEHIDEFDSFITHQHQKLDIQKFIEQGAEAYSSVQQNKRILLNHLLNSYNDGRKKTLFCVAVNLLELSELQEAMNQIQSNDKLPLLPIKEQCSYVAEILQRIADRRNIKLKLMKKK